MPQDNPTIKELAKEAEEWADKQKLLQMSEISLVLDTYDDIFSDFDPRSFDHRALSDDFLSELKRASREKSSGVIEIHFLIPAEMRKEETEALVKHRLREHFRKHYELVETEISSTRRRGGAMVVVGLVISVLGAIFLAPLHGFPESISQLLIGVGFFLFEPGAWFTIWTGLDKIFETWKELEPDLEFYRKMSKSEISFTTY